MSILRKYSLLTSVCISLFATLRLGAECSSTAVVQVPATACKSGTATAGVATVAGASYAWTVDGGTIAGDATGDHVSITLGTAATAKVSVTITADGCTSRGSSVITLHDPFAVHATLPAASHANQPLTILWAYDNGSPARQTISGSDFGSVTLTPDARSYIYTPATSGSKEVVIDAALAGSPEPAPVNSRRRAVVGSPAGASSCAAVHETMRYAVSACVEPPIVVGAPESVITGTTVEIGVAPQPGAVASWTIVNGTPDTATGDTITVTAGASGSIDIIVELKRGACIAQLRRSIPIVPKPACTNPKAEVSAGPVSCGTAIVNAVFTGTPPFHGVWSDQTEFTTSKMAMARTVTLTGNYTLLKFEDATCPGTSSGVAVFPFLGPTATIEAKPHTCVGVDDITVRFTGTPPFTTYWPSAYWPDVWPVTNGMELTRPAVAGHNGPSGGVDGTGCRLTILGGSEGHERPKVHLGKSCPQLSNSVTIYPDGALASPVTVKWADGVTETSNSGYRSVSANPQQTTTYALAGVHDAYCEAILQQPLSVTVSPHPLPVFEQTNITQLCRQQLATISLAAPPPPGANPSVSWYIQGGTPVSGQGYTLQFRTSNNLNTTTTAYCSFEFSGTDACPTWTQQSWSIKEFPYINGTLSAAKAQIRAGETVDLTLLLDADVESWSISNSLNDAIDAVGPPCGNNNQPCHMRYTSSHGAGKSTITLHLKGFCSFRDTQVSLTIVP